MSHDLDRDAPAAVLADTAGPPPIRIVLVEPTHPGNIGAAARAMKNMGLSELILVRPAQFPHSEAIARASGADDVLARARVVDTLQEALAGCGFIAATTARDRVLNYRVVDVREAAVRIVAQARLAPSAVLFGTERSGLTNEDLDVAHELVRIPSGAYASLNLAMAVQLVCYELFRVWHSPQALPPPDPDAVALASPGEMQHLYAHFEQVLKEIEFRDRTRRGTHLMTRIRRFLQRAELDQNEVNILRGILAAVQGRRKIPGSRTAGRAPPPLAGESGKSGRDDSQS